MYVADYIYILWRSFVGAGEELGKLESEKNAMWGLKWKSSADHWRSRAGHDPPSEARAKNDGAQ